MPKELKGSIADFVSRFEIQEPIESEPGKDCNQGNQTFDSFICDEEELVVGDWSTHENSTTLLREIARDCKAKILDSPAVRIVMVDPPSNGCATLENANGNNLRFHLEDELHPPVFSFEEDACIHSVSPFARSTGIRTPDQARTPKRDQCPSSQSQNKFFARDLNSPITLFSKRSDKNLVCKSLQIKITELSQALDLQQALRVEDAGKIVHLEEQLHSAESQLASERLSFRDINDALSKQLHEALEALSDYRLGSQLVAACSECSSDSEIQILRSKYKEHVAELTQYIENLKASYVNVSQQNLALSNQVCYNQLAQCLSLTWFEHAFVRSEVKEIALHSLPPIDFIHCATRCQVSEHSR